MKHLHFILFWLLGIIWGKIFIYMKMESEFASNFQFVLLRIVLGFIPVAVYACIPPIVALVVGVVFVGEKIALWECLGAALILVGVILTSKQHSLSESAKWAATDARREV